MFYFPWECSRYPRTLIRDWVWRRGRLVFVGILLPPPEMFIREIVITSPAIPQTVSGRQRGSEGDLFCYSLPRGRLGGLSPEARVIYALGQREPGQPQRTVHSIGKGEHGALGQGGQDPHRADLALCLPRTPGSPRLEQPHGPFTRRRGNHGPPVRTRIAHSEGKPRMHPAGHDSPATQRGAVSGGHRSPAQGSLPAEQFLQVQSAAQKNRISPRG